MPWLYSVREFMARTIYVNVWVLRFRVLGLKVILNSFNTYPSFGNRGDILILARKYHPSFTRKVAHWIPIQLQMVSMELDREACRSCNKLVRVLGPTVDTHIDPLH